MITELAESRIGTHTDLKTTQKSARPARANLSPVGHPQTATAAMLTELTDLTVLHSACPWRPADWRFQRARLLAAGHSSESFDDEAVRQTAAFLRQVKGNTGVSLPVALAAIGAAHQIHMAADSTRRDQLEAYLLTGLSFDAIAAGTGIPAAVASTYGDTFYDVASHLNASDWVQLEAIGIPRWPADGPRRGDVWRTLAYHGGPAILDLVLADDLGYPEPHYPDRL